VALGGRLLFGERFAYTFLGGMAVALAGVVLLVGGGPRPRCPTALRGRLAVLAAVFYAGYILASAGCAPRSRPAAVMTYGAVVTCAVLRLSPSFGREPARHDLLRVADAGRHRPVSQVGGQSMITYALADLPAAFSSVGLLLQPVAAALLAWGHPGRSPRWVAGAGRRRRADRYSPRTARQRQPSRKGE
jgi:drug/metabolite transporter (DMT)-like permease